MKKYFLLVALAPSFLFAQKTGSASAEKNIPVSQVAAGNKFTITGTISGIPDNSAMNLLNPNKGA